jgi:hypothetical protein
MVFDKTSEFDTVSDCILVREKIRSLSAQYRSYVDRRPIFWNRVLLTPATLAHVAAWIESAGTLSLDVTIRLDTDSPILFVSGLDCHVNSRVFMRSAMGLVTPLVSRCTDLTVEAESFAAMNFMLGMLENGTPSILRVFTVSFSIASIHDFPENGLSFFHFATTPASEALFKTHPAAEAPFNSYDTLSILPTSAPMSRCIHVANGSTSCTFFQSRRQAISWSDFVGMLNPRGDYETITLRDVLFSSSFHGLNTSPPFPDVSTLDLALCGNLRMAYMISLLNWPNIKTVIFRLTRGEDIQCIASCNALLSTITTLRIVCEFPFTGEGGDVLPGSFPSLFSLLPQLKTLDLRYAAPSVVDGFIAASALPSGNIGFEDVLNWHACPRLRQLDLGSVPLSRLTDLASARRRCGYANLDGLSTLDIQGNSEEISRWFSTQFLRHTEYPM